MAKVLVVDDDQDLADYVANALEILGHDVDVATDPEEFSKAFSIDTRIAFVDLFMPAMDGIEIVRFFADNASNISLVLMSGQDTSILHAARQLAENRGLNVLGTLQKPFVIDDIEQALTGYSEKASPQSSNQGATTVAVSSKHWEPTLQDIARGLEQDEFFIVYQPQVRLADGAPTGAEALIRWNHPEHGTVSPGVFVPLAERTPLMPAMTAKVADTAFRDIKTLRDSQFDITVSFNLSACCLNDLGMPEELAAMANHHQVPTSRIVVEITETAVTEDTASFSDILTRLRMKGFNLAIDDFGTGYSSMQQLVRAPFNELKIDQSFVRPLPANEECQRLVESAITLAHSLKMKVVAEGIETDAIGAFLKDQGCDIGQGYGIARPMPFNAFRDWLGQRVNA